MKKFKFKKIDAFASENSSGNPAGVIYLDNKKDLSTEQMQRIGTEFKGAVSEVGFIWKENENCFGLKYYSSLREVDFCGHATIAIMYDLIKNDINLLSHPTIQINIKNSKLIVENKIIEDDSVFITSPTPKIKEFNISKKSILNALDINEDFIENKFDFSIINAGLETLIIPISNLDYILKISPNEKYLKEFCQKSSIDIIILFSTECINKNNSYRTRVFAPTFGYLEDPATGSGNSALGQYLLKRKLWDGNIISIEQNSSKKRYNTIKLIAKENNTKVLFGGSSKVKVDGIYNI